ncbi:hypothetical protein DHEL01_v207762 [Diaporthe helianthi]|uniref:Uncharacterized protein n=1 Tax=Diaporthe helianthi TaxID=158607 RepID=A0A2P5HUD3_DIAHE|nr:hypothetical protein DHEL01_v207762 [Diaporthe helianthi]
MFGFSSNPFLPTAEDSSPVTRPRCNAPGCQEFVANGYPACPFHMRPVSPKLSKGLDSQQWTGAPRVNGRLSEGAPHSRKQLDAKVTARKSIAAKPAFLLTASRTNGTRLNGSGQSAMNRIVTNGSNLSPSSSLLLQRHPGSPETPSKKRQRMTSPGDDKFSPRVSQRNFDLPSRDPSPAHGNLPVRNFGSPLPNGSSGPFYTDKDKWRLAGHVARLDTSSTQQPPSEMSLDTGPATTPLRSANSNDARRPGRVGSSAEPVILSHTDWRSPSARNSLAPEKQSRGSAPTKARRGNKIAKSAYGGLKPVTRPTPLEKQRQLLTDAHDASALERFIYGQEGSSQPPPGVAATAEREPPKRENVFYGHIDPRTHWTRPRSGEWYQKKEEEIQARGGRKANFGKAVQRMREQRLKENPGEWEEKLPERVRNNEAWLGAMRYHHSRIHGVASNQAPQASEQQPPVRKKRKYTRRNQVLVPPIPPESSDAAPRVNADTLKSNTGQGSQPPASSTNIQRVQKRQTNHSLGE